MIRVVHPCAFANGMADLVAESAADSIYLKKGFENPTVFQIFHERKHTDGTIFERRPVGCFTFSTLQACCAVVVSTNSYLNDKPWNLGHDFHALKERVARDAGYSMMLATTETSNFPEIIGAAKAHWRLGKAFTNKRTGHQLTIMTKELP